MKHHNPLQLNNKSKKIYKLANTVVFFVFFIFLFIMLIKTIFPSQFFTYSFDNINSLKNTLTDTKREDDVLSFYASTPLNFSQVKINLELSTANSDFEDKKISLQKSFKAFFYPETTALNNLEKKEENTLVSIEDSVFIIGNQKRTPIDSTVTFESLGYNWDNLKPNTTDLSIYEKQKLADINAAHPTGTILKTSENSTYYFIENFSKRKIAQVSKENIKNPISVDEKSLTENEYCTLEKSKLFNTNYSCTIPLSQIINLKGKDYRFAISNLPNDIKIKKIDIEFKKSLNQGNFQFFLGELKKKILYRFGFKDI